MISREIKDLSIALEALTRVPGSDDEMCRIRNIIRDKLVDMEDRHTNQHPHHQTPPNDEIPF